ncbi:MAG: hypothetical protein CL942_08210 [Desulfovibrio sp.]|nr:hypothetical protein [Desulfovibrio sp.]
MGVPASSLSEWQDIFLAHGAEGFKKRSSKNDLENRRLKKMVGEQAMTIDLLEEKLERVQ